MNEYPPRHANAAVAGRSLAARLAQYSTDGFGMVLFFWALMLTLIGGVTLIASGFAFGSGWPVLAGVAALFLYGRIGALGHQLLDRLLPYDG